jgi:hypothetical protein
LDGPFPKLRPAVALSHQDGRHSAVALLLKAALIQVSDYRLQILFLLSKWFQTRRFLWEFPIGSYVKLSLAVVAILVGGLKGTTQGSFQQSSK